MSDEKEKEGSFDPRCVADIYDKLSNHNYALRAFGALLKSSDFNELSDDSAGELPVTHPDHPCNLRWGLSQIIDLYLAHQESILAGYVDQYHKSDICLLRRAKYIIDSMNHGSYQSKNVAIRELREAADRLDTVINRNGELKEKAEELKNRCMEYLQPLTGKKAVGG
ncbi:MAG: hypothetical protein E3K37_01570 [Candidatus Kuenenia sp.]|nr:hypothetical protein [Candidatus Kuenenia hertensis]